MPINTGDNDASQLLEEISKLKLSGGSGASFKYAKSAINCQIPANTETKILDSNSDCSREILVISNSPDAKIELFWNDGTNKVKIPDILDNLKNRYFDYSDGGLELLVKPDINANIDIYVRSTKPILEKVGNTILIPEIEEPWHTWYCGFQTQIAPFRIPIKPVFIFIDGWDESMSFMSLIELPITDKNGYENQNKRSLGNELPIRWEGFSTEKRYVFYINFDSNWSENLYLYDETSINQDSEKWTINLYT